MTVIAINERLADIAADAIVIGLTQTPRSSGPAEEFNRATGGLLSRLIEAKEITGKKSKRQRCSRRRESRPAWLSSSAWAKEHVRSGRCLSRRQRRGKDAGGQGASRVAFFLADNWPAEFVEAAVAGSVVGCVGSRSYRAKKNRFPFGEIVWAGVDSAAVSRGEILGEAVNLTRRLVNEPPSEMYPESFAAAGGQRRRSRAAWRSKSGTRRGWKPSAAARCWPSPAVRSREPRLVILKYSGGRPARRRWRSSARA